MSSTALIQLNGETALTELDAAILAELADEGNAYDVQFPRVKIAPGGVGQFQVGDKFEKSFTAIVALSQKIRGYWPAKGLGTPPLCSSPDGVHGVFNSDPSAAENEAAMKAPFTHPGVILLNEKRDMPPAFDCGRCPLNQWGSEHQRDGKAGKGKGCKEMRRLLVLVDGFALPALFNLPPTSIRAWDAYCSALAARRSAYFAVKTRFDLDSAKAGSGETYNLVKVSPLSVLTIGEIGMVGEIRRQYREFVAGMAIDAAEYDTVDAAATGTPTIHVAEAADDVPFGDEPGADETQPELISGGKKVRY